MEKNKKLRKNLYILIAMNASLILFAFIYTLFFEIKEYEGVEFVCAFQSVFHFYCPGCGGSRSLKAFLHFDFLNSFLLYPPIPIGAFVVFSYDIRLLLTLIKKTPNIQITINFTLFYLSPFPSF